jgi:uncharacterized protein YjiS (DUF1127 family)
MSDDRSNDQDSRATMWGAQHTTDRILRAIATTIARAADTLEAERRRRTLERQLNALDDRDIADIGIARDQIQAIAAAYPDAPQLLHRMMERVGIEPDALCRQAGLRREMEWNCVACSSRSQCRRWLKSAKPDDAYRSFCPNAAGLDRLSAAQAASG